VVRNGVKVLAPDCIISGDCERFMINRYPQNYMIDGEPIAGTLPCSPCDSVLSLQLANGALSATVQTGACHIDQQGAVFRSSGMATLNAAFNSTASHATRPEAGIEGNDGADASDIEYIDEESYDKQSPCDGEYLERRIRDGKLTPATTFECPLSVKSGNHCLLMLHVGDDGSVQAEVGGELTAWQPHCLQRHPQPEAIDEADRSTASTA
jgi:hypothetical protein